MPLRGLGSGSLLDVRSWELWRFLLAFPCVRVGVQALPLCGAAPTFFAAAKKVGKESRFTPLILKRVPRLGGGSGTSGVCLPAPSAPVTRQSYRPPRAARSPERSAAKIGMNLSAFLCARRLADLAARVGEALSKQDGKLVHRGRPVERRPYGLRQHVAQCQPQQLDGGLVIGEVAAGLDDLA